MYEYKGRFVLFNELSSLNELDLHNLVLNNMHDYKSFISKQEIPVDFSLFQELIKVWFSNGRLYQFLIFNLKTEELIGTVFFYTDGKNIKFSIFLIKNYRKSIFSAESILVSIQFLYKELKEKNIYFSVFKKNKQMLNFVTKKNIFYISENKKKCLCNFLIKENQIKKALKILSKFYKRDY